MVRVVANARISLYSANVTLTQTFVPKASDGPTPPEATYSFPVYPSSSVVSFVARVKVQGSVTRTIRGVVKALPTARKEYDEAVARGETAGFLEQIEEDVFTMKLGNIPHAKDTEVDVDIGYVTELKHDSEVDGIRFTIPTAIAPRYGSSPEGVHSTSGTHVRDGLEMNVEIDMPGPVTSVQSPSHPIAVTVGSLGPSGTPNQEFNNAQAFAKLSQTRAYLESDFILQILCKDSESPRAILESHMNEHGAIDSAALMLTFVPKFVIPATPGIKKPRKEVIFMIDRSGSMQDKVEALKSALKVFLKSLPPNDGIRFDVCSFGSYYTFLFDENGEEGSKLYSQSTLNTALKHVETISADYRGTEIFAPIKEICDRVSKRNAKNAKEIQAGGEGRGKTVEKVEWETEILLLTDGEVWNAKPLFDLVRDETQEWRSKGKKGADGRAGIRLFTLGIGNDVSHGFVEGLAKVGGGYAMTVGEAERFEGKVVRMLKAALGERVGGYQVTFDGMKDWGGAAGIETLEGSDDFEMVDKPPAYAPEAHPPPPTAAPISLFDPSANPDAVTEAGDKPKPSPSLIPLGIIRAPQVIPPLFPFNRTNIYLLLSPRTPSPHLCLPQTLTLQARTSNGQPLELAIPVSKVLAPASKTIHQLATKKYLDDLKAGESWIHTARGSGEKLECIYGQGDSAKRGTIQLHAPESDNWDQDVFDVILKQEGERIGTQWGVVGKWTAFVALEETSQGQRIIEGKESFASVQKARLSTASHSTRSIALSANPYQYSTYSAQPYQYATYSAQPYQQQQAYSLRAGSSSGGTPSVLLSAQSAVYIGASSFDGSKSKGFGGSKKKRSAVDVSHARTSSSAVDASHARTSSFGNIFGSMMRGRSSKGDSVSESTAIKDASPPAPLPIISDADATAKFIELQDFEGYWDLSQDLVNCFSAQLSSAKLNIPKLQGIAAKELSAIRVAADTMNKVLATAMATVWLQHRLAGEKDTWELVVDKGMDWLRTAVTSGDVNGVLAKAKEILELGN